MIHFLLKGLIRDKSRSLLPVIVVSVGVTITVFLQAYMNGVFTDSLETAAKLTSGHVKVVTQAYKQNITQMPNDYAITESEVLLKKLETEYTDIDWAERIMFGGLLDAPDSTGNTRAQGNVGGLGIHLLKNDVEMQRMDLNSKLISGRFPEKSGEILVSNDLFKKMNLQLGDAVTLMSSTMFGNMAMYNFTVCGTLHFGMAAIDKGMIYADIEDVRLALNMEDATGEILGFFRNSTYDNKRAKALTAQFNSANKSNDDLFTPVMIPMFEASGMDFMITYAENAQLIVILIFVFAMSIVLWNAGLLGGLRRYGEFGLRLAIGESKNETYRSLIGEAMLIGVIGSFIGSAFGLFFAWLMQTYGIDAGDMIQDSTIIMPTVFRAHINVTTWYIGFIPGLLSTVIGAMLAGIGIYKRQTANLFKELQA